jgi:hypothetical protein
MRFYGQQLIIYKNMINELRTSILQELQRIENLAEIND